MASIDSSKWMTRLLVKVGNSIQWCGIFYLRHVLEKLNNYFQRSIIKVNENNKLYLKYQTITPFLKSYSCNRIFKYVAPHTCVSKFCKWKCGDQLIIINTILITIIIVINIHKWHHTKVKL